MARSQDQLARLNRRLMGVPDAIKLALQPALDQSAREIVELAKKLAPRDQGDLIDSIHVEAGEHDLARKIVAGDADAFYARWVEFGTVATPQQAFLFPAYRLLRDKMKRRLSRVSAKAVKDHWNKP